MTGDDRDEDESKISCRKMKIMGRSQEEKM
jgi:hypothetical protein